MEIKTYRAKSMQEALRWIRRDLGPEAAVLHTREINAGVLGWFQGRQLEVTAGLGVHVPSRFESATSADSAAATRRSHDVEAPPRESAAHEDQQRQVPPAHEQSFRTLYRNELRDPRDAAPSLVEELCQRSASENHRSDRSDALAQLYARLVDADFEEDVARELADRVGRRSSGGASSDLQYLEARLMRLIEEEIECVVPVRLTAGARRVLAFVGPTGVGKTTTIAKLAANFHFHQQKRVGLITVDTYRVAAVDQLQTYADIIDLPMEVVSNPLEMKLALAKLATMELVLLDTAGHNPGDEVRIEELRMLLRDANADDVQLVCSSVASASSLKQAINTFASIGATRLVLTKLDEASGLGHLWPVLRRGKLPLSYVTHGQNVPDDIAPADPRKLARRLLKMDRAQ